ncbi:MAG: TPM domain-containing protein [Bacteroidetes bacterium]|nr:TPM domain-containing protein [Bacteroidota bacterium]MCL5737329.1 TPM domain-containing protein [Bacteroidota bacterium]
MHHLNFLRPAYLLLFLFLASFHFALAQKVPALTQFVTDQAGVLTSDQTAALDARLKTYQDTTSNQIVVLIVNSVPEGDLESYSISVAEQNKIGQKGKDNGILFMVDVGDHKARFEVGYGLEGIVPDAIASYIIDEIVIPEFKSNDYYDGIDRGITALAAQIGGTFHADLKKHRDGGSVLPVIIIFIFIFVFPMLFGSRKYSASSRGVRSSWWFFPFFGGFGGGGFGGGGFGGGGGGFGGFSGGGGGFGGGGASGSW